MSIVLIVAAYLVGSIPVGVLVGRARGFDPRTLGSGNVGMTNIARTGDRAAAAITFAGDILKGLLPVLAAELGGFDVRVVALAGLAAFVGSLYSIFIRFGGGRGVSTSLGIWLVLAPAALGAAVVVFALVFAARRIMSMASMAAAVVLPIGVAWLGYARDYLALAIVISALVLIRHRANINRLLRGQEPVFRIGGSAPRGEQAT